MTPEYSDYIVYVDESGDHGMRSIHQEYPVFSLAFCIFKKSDYVFDIDPSLNFLKSKYWGHWDVVLHEHDIRKNRSDDWSFLTDGKLRNSFLSDINTLIEESKIYIIASVIHKKDLTKYPSLQNPYELAMFFCMERLNDWLINKNQTGRIIQVHFESRGKNEDSKLKDDFRQIRNNTPTSEPSRTDFSKITYRMRFLDKKVNSTGLQLADLVVRPIGLHSFKPDQPNRAFEIINNKFITLNNGYYQGKCLKIFPDLQNKEKPR